MHALRHSSSRFAGSLSFHTSSTLVGLVRKGSKGAYNARFITGAATANVEVDSSDLKEPSNDKYNKIENHSKGQQTGSSLNNTSTTNIQKKHDSENDQFTKAKLTKSKKGSKYSGNEMSKSQAYQRSDNSNGFLKNFLITCAPDEGADTSNNWNSATQDVQMPVPNDRTEENDDFSELDYSGTDLQSAKLAFRPSNNLLTNATQHVRMPVSNGRSEENDDFFEQDSLSTSSQSTKYNKIENHSKGQQTGSSLNNTSTTNIQKKHDSKNDQFTKAKLTKSKKGSKYSGNEMSESQAYQRSDNSKGFLKNFLIACAPDEGVDTSNNGISATQDFQMPVPNDSSEENDDFSELDYPGTDLQSAKLAFRPSNNRLTNATQHVRMPVPNGRSEENDDFFEQDSLSTGSQSTKLVTAIEKGLSLRKEHRPSANSEATTTEESFCKVLDSVSTSSRSIPVRKTFVNRSDFEKKTERGVDNAQLPESRFILGDDGGVGKEKKDEQARKQKSRDHFKESNTFLGGERSVCIEYVPRGVSLFHLREALSIHGEIVGSFFQNEDSAMPNCYIEFKTIEAKERALAARWVFVNGRQLSIWRLDFPVTTIARISNLSSEITATTVHSVCRSYGNVESLQVRKDGSMDVQYSIDELSNMPKVLEMLNEVSISDSRWIAQPAPRLPKGLAKTPEGQKWAGKQLSNYIGNTKKHLQLLRIYLEDMEELHNAVMHIKECPMLPSNESCSTK